MRIEDVHVAGGILPESHRWECMWRFSVGNLAGLFKRQAWMRKYLVRIEDVHVESFYLKGIVRIERMKQNIFQHLDRRGLWN